MVDYSVTQKSSSKDKRERGEYICTVGSEVIREAHSGTKGDNAVFCNGTCKSWLHRRCAELSSTADKEVTDSQKPFLCTYCCLSEQDDLITLLKTRIDTLNSDISSLKEQIPTGATRSVSPNENSIINAEEDITTATLDIHEVPSSYKPQERYSYTQMNPTDRSHDPNRNVAENRRWPSIISRAILCCCGTSS